MANIGIHDQSREDDGDSPEHQTLGHSDRGAVSVVVMLARGRCRRRRADRDAGVRVCLKGVDASELLTKRGEKPNQLMTWSLYRRPIMDRPRRDSRRT